MADKKGFDLGDYVEVKDRIRILYELYPQARLVTSHVEVVGLADGEYIMVRAEAYRTPDDPHPGTGTSWMKVPGATSYTRGSEVENAETSAWGRAIGSLGILIDGSIASRQEVENKQDGPDKIGPLQAQSDLVRSHDPGGIIGKVTEAKDSPGFLPHVGPEGSVLTFKLVTNGRGGIKAIVKGPLADQLAMFKDAIMGERVTCWGHISDESFTNKADRTITYQVLNVERMSTPAGMLPVRLDPGDPLERSFGDEDRDESDGLDHLPIPVVEGQLGFEPLTDEEKAAIGGGLPG